MADMRDLELMTRPFVNDCPRFLVNNELMRASRSFFHKTQCWHENIIVGFGKGRNMGQMAAPEKDQAIIAVVDVMKRGTTQRLRKSANKRVLVNGAGDPREYTATTSTLLLGPAPKDTFIAEVIVAVRPSLAATSIPEKVLEESGETIVAGALHTLLNMRECNWSDPAMADTYRRKFNAGVRDMLNKLLTGFVNMPGHATAKYPFI